VNFNFDDELPQTPTESESIEVGRNVSGASPAFQQAGLDNSSKLDVTGVSMDVSTDVSFVSHGEEDFGPDMDTASADFLQPEPKKEEPAEFVDEEEEEPEPAPVKKRIKKKRKVRQFDERTELATKVISKGLQDVSDITVDVRPNCSKRARMEEDDGLDFALTPGFADDETDRAQYYTERFARGSVGPLFRNVTMLAPELQGLVLRSLTVSTPADHALEEPLEEEEEVMPVEEQVPEPFEDGPSSLGQEGEMLPSQEEYFDPGMESSFGDVTNDVSYDSVNDSISVQFDEQMGQDDADVNEIFPVSAEEEPSKADTGGDSRTAKFRKFLVDNPGEEKNTWQMEKLLEGRSRYAAALVFFEVLQLRTRGFVHTEQEETYGDITISATKKFNKSLRVH
jgi:hypothetical protein